MNVNDAKTLIIQVLHAYLLSNYSNTHKLAITMDCSKRFADVLLYIHRTDDTWHTIAINITDISFTIKGRIVKDKWEGWRIITDDSQPTRFTTSREHINQMHRIRDLIAYNECIPWQEASAYVLFPVTDKPSDSDDWYGSMTVLGVGALPYQVIEHNKIDISYFAGQLSGKIY